MGRSGVVIPTPIIKHAPELAQGALEDEVHELLPAEVRLGALGQPELALPEPAELLQVELVLEVPQEVRLSIQEGACLGVGGC